jgi:zinc protease
MGVDGVMAHKLENGLTLIIKEVHTAPVASCWIWYRVGSRNEVAGMTGISHWVEHMMFKGTERFGKGAIMRLVNKNGGTLNGFTSQDYTVYFETLPADRLSLGLHIEADRMANSLFDPAEAASERTVIISEREGAENSPTFLLNEEVSAAAFKVHPYGHPVIGWKDDLRGITREELWQHYKTYYGPHNALLVVAGDIATGTVLKEVEALFGPIPPGPPPPPVRQVEPPQQGERRVVVRRPGTTAYFQAVFHISNGRHPDIFPLLVLDAVLSGAKPMNLFGGGVATHKSARLYRALVETELASRASSGFGLSADPGLFHFHATVREGRTLEEVEAAMLLEIERIRQELVSSPELSKAVKQARAQFAYSSESVTNQAFWLGYLEMLDSYRRLDTFLGSLAAVTAQDVQRVAQLYLGEDNHTVGWFMPTHVSNP